MLGVEPYVILIEKWVLVLFDDALKVGYGSREVDIMFRILNIYVFLSIFVEILPFLDIEYLIFLTNPCSSSFWSESIMEHLHQGPLLSTSFNFDPSMDK